VADVPASSPASRLLQGVHQLQHRVRTV